MSRRGPHTSTPWLLSLSALVLAVSPSGGSLASAADAPSVKDAAHQRSGEESPG